MSQEISIANFLDQQPRLYFDARSPSEFRKAHIPGAVNFPLFNDDERAAVGTCYKNEGPEEAMLLGLDLVGPKLGDFLREARRLNPQNAVIRLYCFRGGQRSQSLAWLLKKGGFQVEVLTGGYKSYRREVLRSFEEEQNILVLSGCTGSGKTRLLHALEERGEQMIDLEGLACHRGSAFGGYAQPETLTTEMFQNLLHQVWSKLNRERRVWIEDEGRTLGRLLVPDGVWQQMRAAPVLYLDVSQDQRVQLLVQEYGEYDRALLGQSIDRISRRLGGKNYKLCREALMQGELAKVARYCLDYYDKAYLHCLKKRQPKPMWTLSLSGIETARNAECLLTFAKDLGSCHPLVS